MNTRKTEVFLKLIEVLKNWDNKLEMREYLNISGEKKHYHAHINDCGTCACVGGLVPLADKEFADKFINYSGEYRFREMTSDLVENKARDWEYIFGEHWGNNPKRAIGRIRNYLKKGAPPKHYKSIDCFN